MTKSNYDVIDIKQLKKLIRTNNYKVYIWGAYEIGQSLYKLMEKEDIANFVLGFCDSSPEKLAHKFCGLEVKKYEDLPKNDNILYIITSGSNGTILYDIIKQDGGLGIIFDLLTLLKYFELPILWRVDKIINETKKYLMTEKKYIDEIIYLKNLWADEKSKKIFEAIINFRETKNTTDIFNYLDSAKLQYLDPIIPFRDKEVILDVGAYTGDTLQNIQNSFKNKGLQFAQYIALEPMENAYNELSNYVQTQKFKNVKIINKGAWNKKETLSFDVNSVRSQINSAGEVKIQTDTIDNICKNTNITYLKMDIEGAMQTIIRDNPKCAISVYHEWDDLILIPLYLHKINPKYKLYLRFYTLTLDDVICYAL
ncbi:hypothetical protein AN641_09620 [Candidatus Epulonipiscioides gigas]|nr:hypothetical protein AN641_09620 [Epulopiscium sp. SCG-C07WGA-EpuloA2]